MIQETKYKYTEEILQEISRVASKVGATKFDIYVTYEEDPQDAFDFIHYHIRFQVQMNGKFVECSCIAYTDKD